MKLNQNKFALAAGITAGLAYAVCAVFTWFAPDLAIQFLGWTAHIVNVEKFAGDVEMTAQGFVLGLLPILLYSYLGAWFFARLYNRFTV